ncbi:MAG TPA: LysR family transcriptional regulator [Planctomycetota bacterium]|nr:LysR family transcriptional regulator [Planctomycetota bacterium]
MPGIRMHQLEGFFNVARYGNYTKAAQQFSYPIGQPAVYQQVKGLQEDLGVLLVRQAGPRRTELTPEGRELFNFIAPFFDGLPKVMERLTSASSEPLVLAADQFLAMEALPPALLKLKVQNPHIQLRMHERATRDVIQAVLTGEADAGLLHLMERPQGLRWEPLGQIGAALLVPAGHPLAKLDNPSFTEVAKYPLIVYEPNSPSRQLTERLFKESGRKLIIAVEVTFSQTMRAFVRTGLAPAFIPFLRSGSKSSQRSTLPREPNTISFDVSSRLKGGALPFGLLFRSGMEESLALRKLLKALREIWG